MYLIGRFTHVPVGEGIYSQRLELSLIVLVLIKLEAISGIDISKIKFSVKCSLTLPQYRKC